MTPTLLSDRIHPSGTRGRSETSGRIVRAGGVDIEIDDFDAALWSYVTVTGMPGAIAEMNMAHLVQPEASPFTTSRQAGSALSAELVSECSLLTSGVAENDRAKFAAAPVVETQDLLPTGHGLGEQVVDVAWHCIFLRSIRR
jgi:hypothetical protein